MTETSTSSRHTHLRSEVEMLNARLVGNHTSTLLDKSSSTSWFKKDGFWSWVACGCAVMNQLLIFGTLNIYSLFLVKFQKEFNCTTAEAAWLGSLTLGLMKLFGPLSSSLVTHSGERFIMMLGSFLCAASVLGSSFAPTFESLFGTLCIPFALGAAFTITPSMMVPVDYFNKNQNIAMGIVAAGSSIGTLILAPTMQYMLDILNWRMTFRVHSVSLSVLIFLNSFMKARKRQTTFDYIKKPIFRTFVEDLSLWKNRVFTIWAMSLVIVYFGYQTPNILLASYATFLGVSIKDASYIIMAMGLATTLSRLVTGKLLTCKLLSRLHFKQTIFVLMGTAYLLLPQVTNIEGLYVFAVVRGLLDGAHIVMLPMLTSSMVGSDKALIGWGNLAGAISITYSIGPPLAGLLKDETGSYNLPFIMAGIPLILAGLLLFWLPWAERTGKRTNILVAVSAIPVEEEPSSYVEVSSNKNKGAISRMFGSKKVTPTTSHLTGMGEHKRGSRLLDMLTTNAPDKVPVSKTQSLPNTTERPSADVQPVLEKRVRSEPCLNPRDSKTNDLTLNVDTSDFKVPMQKFSGDASHLKPTPQYAKEAP